VNFRLTRACEADIRKHNCLEHISAVAGFKNAVLSAVLLCLESAMKDGRNQFEFSSWDQILVLKQPGKGH